MSKSRHSSRPDYADVYARLRDSVHAATVAEELALQLKQTAQTQAYEAIDGWLRFALGSLEPDADRATQNAHLMAHELRGNMLEALLQAFGCNELQLGGIIGDYIMKHPLMEGSHYTYIVDVESVYGRRTLVLRALSREERVA